ncbi:MAG: hypothetical protein R3B74_09015 [Nitrospirales bacterium]|nr:hypothetical protein [Nitrospirales bacterium]
MKTERNHFIGLLITGIMGGMLFGCSSVELSKIPKKPLPASPPLLTELPLELPPEGGERRPVGSSAFSVLQGNAPNIVIVEKDSSALRAIAEHDSKVKTALGERYGFIDMEEVDADQCRITILDEDSGPQRLSKRPANQAMVHRLTYYTYTHNSAVHVSGIIMSHWCNRTPGRYQPGKVPETGHAIALARQDPRIAQDVRNLFSHAILTSPEEYRYFWVSDEAGFGDRVLWVTFSEGPESLALYFARVDLTTDQVLDAGKERATINH